MPIVWDEGDTIERAGQIADFGTAPDDRGWPYTTVREGHPPLAGYVIALGQRVAPSALSPLTRARFGPILLFSAALGVMYYRLQRDYRCRGVSVVAVLA